MATDQSPERNEIIFGLTFMTTATLVVLHFVFGSYFEATTTAERSTKLASREPLEKLRAEAEAQLRSGGVPIDEAMARLSRGRLADAVIAPTPSDDLGALEGWSQMPNPTRAEAARRATAEKTTAMAVPPTPEVSDGAPLEPRTGSASAAPEPRALPTTPEQPNPGTKALPAPAPPPAQLPAATP